MPRISLFLATAWMLALPTMADAKLYRNGAVGKTIEAVGGEDRDLYALSIVEKGISYAEQFKVRDTRMKITLRAGTRLPLTLIAYDLKLREIGRASSDTGVVSLVAELGWDDGYLRVVPSGGRYDTPVGSKFQRTVDEGGSADLLPAYFITFEKAGGSSPAVQTASNDAAKAPKSGATGATFSRWRAAPTPEAALPAAPTANANAPTGATALMRHRGGQTAAVAKGTGPTTQLPVQPVSIAAAQVGPVDAKRWGAIAGMIGTVWKDQFQIYRIEWDRPGEAIRIGVEGLFGEQERLIVPDADGKSLRYIYLDTATKQQFDERIAVERGKAFATVATPTHQSVCTPVSKGAALSCVVRPKVRTKQPAQITSMTRTDAAGAQALLASLPGRFPGRPAGQFDPQLGVLAEMASQRWSAEPKPTSDSTPELLEFGRTTQGPALIAQIRGRFGDNRAAYLQANGTGPLIGSYYAGTIDSPNFIGSVKLTVDEKGSASLCSTAGCDQWLLSRDGQVALRMRQENGQQSLATYRPIPAAKPSGNALLDQLNGKMFMGPKKRTLAFLTSNGAFRLTKSWATGERHATTCYTTVAGLTSVECYRSANSTTRKDVPLIIRETEIEVDGHVYALRGENIAMKALGSAEESLFTPSSAGLIELAWHSEDDREEQARLRRENRIQTAEKARRSREMYGAIMGAAQAIGGAMAGNGGASNAFQPSVYRNTSSGIAQPSGYSSMGTTSYVPHAPASAAYLQQQDELQRYEIRKQLYGTGGGGSSGNSSQPYAKALEQRDRAAEESYARKAALDAQVQASRDQEARAFANSLDSKPGVGLPSGTSSSGSSSAGGIIVSNGQPSATALKAAAEEKARIAAGEERHRLAEIERKRIEADMARQDAEFKAKINTFDKGVCPLSENATVVCR